MTNNGDMPEIPVETLAETTNYTIWAADEPDGEKTYHVELGPVTAHFFGEEWDDFLTMIREAAEEPMEKDGDDDDENDVEVELDWGSLYFAQDEWVEFLQLIAKI